MQVEVKVLLHGVRLCAQYGCVNIHVQMDSRTLVDVLIAGTSYPWSVSLEIEELKATKFESISYCYRVANRIFDILVGCESQANKVYFNYFDLPWLVFDAFKIDRIGMPSLRECKSI